MTDGTLKAGLWAELARWPDLFDAVRPLQPALAAHATVLSVLGALNDGGAESYGEKERLTRAILTEHQASLARGDPRRIASFWTTLLLAAFYPMLVRLRFAITPDAIEREDLDQVVIECFLRTAGTLRIEGRHRLALRLKHRTRRAVFRQVRDERRDRRSRSELSAQLVADGAPVPHPRHDRAERFVPDPEEVDSLAGLLVRHAGGSIEQAQLDLVIATLIRGERLSSIVDREHPGLSTEERSRVYERIKRKHSRTMTRLQKLLRGIDFSCPGPSAGGLLPDQPCDPQETTG